MNAFETMVYEKALESVGSFENSIQDGWIDEGELTRDELFNTVRGDVVAECPREVRFLGNARIDEICYHAVDGFEFRTW